MLIEHSLTWRHLGRRDEISHFSWGSAGKESACNAGDPKAEATAENPKNFLMKDKWPVFSEANTFEEEVKTIEMAIHSSILACRSP